jgi:alpha-tubulin suppressor-like RCC1 family protein
MKIVSSLKRDHNTAGVCTFLIIVALVTVMTGCAQPAVLSYELTISSTAGGSVAIPGEGTSTYDEGAMVSLVATADPGYQFITWSGDVSTMGEVNEPTTTIVMNAAYSVTANFSKQQYGLTTTSTAGGSITTPGEGTFVYDGETVVSLVAEAQESYAFVSWTGDVSTIENLNAAQTTIIMRDSYSIAANFESRYTPMVAAGGFHTVGLNIDGTVIAAGYNEYGQSEVSGWSDVIQVAAGRWDTLALKSDGTVVSRGWSDYGQLNVGGWTDITQVATSFFHTVGRKSDGTVVAVGENWAGQCYVGEWAGIWQVAAGGHHTVGLKVDGTVVAEGWNDYGQCDVDDWVDIVQVAAGYTSTLGIRSDGTVVAVGRNDHGQLNVADWTGIVQVVAGQSHTLGLKADGTVVAVGWNRYGQCDIGSWAGIVQISGSFLHTVGLKEDGSVVAVGENSWLQCEVHDWMLL